MSKESNGHMAGSIIGRSISRFTDGENPVKDTAIGAGIFSAGLVGFAAVVSAPITLPTLALAGLIGGAIGLFSGQVKKQERATSSTNKER